MKFLCIGTREYVLQIKRASKFMGGDVEMEVVLCSKINGTIPLVLSSVY